MKPQLKLATWMGAMALLAVPAVAQTSTAGAKVYQHKNAWVEETTGVLTAARNLKVVADSGSVRVRGGDSGNISYTVKKIAYVDSEPAARRAFAEYRLAASQAAEWAALKGIRTGRNTRFTVEISVSVPRQVEAVKLHTNGGHLEVVNVNGRVDAYTGGGHMFFDQIGGDVVAKSGGGKAKVVTANGNVALTTGGGNMYVENVKGNVSARTGGGDVMVGTGGGSVEVETGGGSINVKQCAGSVLVRTGGGNVELGEVGGKAILESGGGNVRLSSASGPVFVRTGGGSIELWKLAQAVRAETAAGRIVAEFTGSSLTESQLRSTSGDIVVYLPSNLSVTVRTAIEMAEGHRIHSDFPELRVTSDSTGYGPKHVSAEGNLNGGGPLLNVRTMAGDIELRRRK